MDYNSLITAIGSVGFPIVAFFVILKQNTKTNEVVGKLTEAVNNNTTAINVLMDRNNIEV